MAAEETHSPASDAEPPDDAGELAWLPKPGGVVAQRFRMEALIGDGGMGAVVSAVHIETGARVAIKFLHPRLAKDAAAVERFVREAKAAVVIKSEHVVRVLDVGRTERGLPYLVMELLEGADLAKVIARGPMPIPLAVDCVLQAAEALAEAHAAGIVHRDIKPANLWLAQRWDGSPSVRVLDFGISKLMTSVEAGAGGITDTRSVFGSPLYMSPEQIRSAKHVDHRTDVWALGVVLFELVTQKLPFYADNVAGILANVLTSAPRSLLRARPDAPPQLEEVFRGALEKDPDKRVSLAAFAASLRPFATAAGIAAADKISRALVPMPSLIPPSNTEVDERAMVAFGETVPSISVAVVTAAPKTPFPLAAILAVAAALAIGIGGTVLYLRTAVKREASHAPPQTTAELAPTPAALPTPTPVVTAPATESAPSLAVVHVPPPRPTASAHPRPTAAGSTRPPLSDSRQ